MSSRRALITGITGQDGLYLSELLLSKGYQVHGLIRGQNNPKRVLVEEISPEIVLHEGDLTDFASIARALKASDPDEVYNLGAVSFVAHSFRSALHTSNVTGQGALNVLEAIRLHDPDNRIRFYQASSSEMFGKVQETPQTETTRFYPRSPYGAAKAFAHHVTVNYREAYGMHASAGILFNHESPRRGPEFVTRKITQAVARISLGLQDEVRLGNLDAARDWGHAQDFVEAMWMMLQQDNPGDYIIATGHLTSVRRFAELAFDAVGIDDWESRVILDPAYTRPSDVQTLLGNPERAQEILGWKAQTTLDDLVLEMVLHDLKNP
ncbi:GDPmannose 4,6-dehydratase [Nocardioides zeae]|uniref:GDPmannose 4,6-dehydratase n=1 Tax=Nocardioides zeae TaxID=1457234 RepID=A0ACC6IJP7_9ACTN|nr:GDP-mannose 4,6-dehydratase [Nocardioides zeae]MDR6173590.1 GDPmannose 4,6-dehydratase [Nocardioides zeae]MDR6210995.1 GDPmannose 4,6-dehydratase [Nocardioides zeae]